MTWQTSGALDNWAYIDGGAGWKHLTQSGDVAIRGMALLAAERVQWTSSAARGNLGP